MQQPHLLIVDDHYEIRELLQRFLMQYQYRVSVAKDGKEMKRCLNESKIDLIVLDLMLPGEDGLSLCRGLRASSTIPIIMLTAMSDEMDKIIGLEMGADDYLAKPFNPRELLARIKAVLRRVNTLSPPASSDLKHHHFCRWSLDVHKRELTDQAGVMVVLSSAEFDLLRVFIAHPQRVLSRDQLLDLSKGREGGVYDRSIDTLISRLRKKLEIDVKHPEILITIWGGGYQFTPEVTHD
tara:strand:- start:9926 stop:10639 length:714 start_codon:yes stop_codon:yes gene_type:complete